MTDTQQNAEQRIAEIAARAEKASKGPWESVPVLLAGDDGKGKSWSESEGRLINGPPQTVEDFTLSKRWFAKKEDGAFIAASRADIPWLLEQLSALRAANANHIEILKEFVAFSECHCHGDPTGWGGGKCPPCCAADAIALAEPSP